MPTTKLRTHLILNAVRSLATAHGKPPIPLLGVLALWSANFHRAFYFAEKRQIVIYNEFGLCYNYAIYMGVI